jgi:hypothetical protein
MEEKSGFLASLGMTVIDTAAAAESLSEEIWRKRDEYDGKGTGDGDWRNPRR